MHIIALFLNKVFFIGIEKNTDRSLIGGKLLNGDINGFIDRTLTGLNGPFKRFFDLFRCFCLNNLFDGLNGLF